MMEQIPSTLEGWIENTIDELAALVPQATWLMRQTNAHYPTGHNPLRGCLAEIRRIQERGVGSDDLEGQLTMLLKVVDAATWLMWDAQDKVTGVSGLREQMRIDIGVMYAGCRMIAEQDDTVSDTHSHQEVRRHVEQLYPDDLHQQAAYVCAWCQQLEKGQNDGGPDG